ncbi:hypothetical protein ACEWY4_004367 [Coilia grayii]|uniref:Homeobox domain-containing protein n=1 Tax=Coilia grayii TaxID=363190 RepID=A0ABD1KLF7_9TELE
MDHPISAPPFLLGVGYVAGFPQRHYQRPPCPPSPASHSSLYRARPPGEAHWAQGGTIPTDISAALPDPGFCLLRTGPGLDANADPGFCLLRTGPTSELGPNTNTRASCLQGVPGLSAAVKQGDLRIQEIDGREDPGLRMEDTQQRTESKLHKKKHSRPTFSGYQIFVLEKAFEQNKYLSSMEKQRLAQSLGMAESQVKVWFQNRRTKWRRAFGSEPEGRTRVTPAQVRPQLDGDYDKPLDPNKDDDRVQRLLRCHGQTHSRPGQASIQQMTKTTCTHFSHCKDV